MQYRVIEDFDHTEQYNCRKPDFRHEIVEKTYCIVVKYVNEDQKNQVLETVEKVFAEHLAKETESNKRHHPDDDD